MSERSHCRCCRVPLLLAALLWGVLLGFAGRLSADEALMKNGMRFQGDLAALRGMTISAAKQHASPVNNPLMVLIDTGMKRYIVPVRQVAERVFETELSRYETFELKQKKSGRQRMVASVGAISDVTPFDKFGRRRVTITTRRGPIHVIQGVTEIGSKYLKVEGLSHIWEHAIATTSVPPLQLDAMLRYATDQSDPDDRMGIARFYLQAGMYPQASAHLASIVHDFPERKAAVEQITVELRQLQAKRLLAELRRRRTAGQHRLAADSLRHFPLEGMSASVLRQVRELNDENEKQRERIERARLLLGELQAQLDDPNLAAALALPRSLVETGLNFESLKSLDPFLKLADDKTLSPAEKLSLAYSGWILGAENAFANFDETIRLWDARLLVVEYLRSDDPGERSSLVSKLRSVEGISPKRVVSMIKRLPMPTETPEALPGRMTTIEIKSDGEEKPIQYRVLLPIEYTPHHQYPLIVALRPVERSGGQMLRWWGGTEKKPGQSQRHGYIVIAPEYVDADQRDYGYESKSHERVLRSIHDARKRFNIDSDRVFLTGHGTGGDAAFDIGMSHPDVFAGVMPIAGIGRHYCKWYWKNVKRLPFYIVAGELDRDSRSQNAHSGRVNSMMRQGYDVIYVEYIGRGYESFYAEIHQLFDWMNLHRRTKYVEELQMKVLRPNDNRFFWLRAEGLPRSAINSDVLSGSRAARVTPMFLHARITPTNSIFIVRSRARQHTIWLAPDFIDFEKKIKVKFRGRTKFSGFVKPSIEAILEDLRIRGDRQKPYWAKLVVD